MKLTLNQIITVACLMTVFFSCSVSPVDIDYGVDECHFCKMTIVDRKHASELVTSKGKIYKYGAIECMIKDLQSKKSTPIALYLINDYTSPSKLIDATKSTFLISKNIPSPMGEYLSGFSKITDADKFKTQPQDQLFNWEEIVARFND